MLDIDFLYSIPFFTEKILQEKELLFDEGDINRNLYIIIDGQISIEKYIGGKWNNTKQLAVSKTGNFLWEGSLSENSKKEIRAIALSKTTVLFIDVLNDFPLFLRKYPKQAQDMLLNIISSMNKREKKSNPYITSMHEINIIIKGMTSFNYKEIFLLLEKINNIMKGWFILFLETNSVLSQYLTVKYDSRYPWKIQNKVVKKWHYSLLDIWVPDWYRLITKDITIGEESLGSILIWRKELFMENERRIFLGMINSLTWILKQKKIISEERDKNFSKN